MKLRVDLKVSPEGEGFNPIIQTIKSTISRTVKYALLIPDAGYNWYGGADISLNTDEQKEVSETVTISKASTGTIEFVISMGKIADIETSQSTVEISDISIIKNKLLIESLNLNAILWPEVIEKV